MTAPEMTKKPLLRRHPDGAWVCNECDAHEYTGAVSEQDLSYLACSHCGCEEFHWEAMSTPTVEVELPPLPEPEWKAVPPPTMAGGAVMQAAPPLPRLAYTFVPDYSPKFSGSQMATFARTAVRADRAAHHKKMRRALTTLRQVLIDAQSQSVLFEWWPQINDRIGELAAALGEQP